MNRERKVIIMAALSLALLILHVSDVHWCYSAVHRTKLGRHLGGHPAIPGVHHGLSLSWQRPEHPHPGPPHVFERRDDGGGGGGALIRSDALGSWEHLRDHQYLARYKFFIFSLANGARTQTEVVTSEIELQGHGAFAAAATFDLFAADGTTPIATRCPINISATRL